jgi:hypothetical protein
MFGVSAVPAAECEFVRESGAGKLWWFRPDGRPLGNGHLLRRRSAISPDKSRLRHLAITTSVALPTVDGRPASRVSASSASSACGPRFTARIAGVSTNADGQLTARCHDARQAHNGPRTPRRKWPTSPLIRAGAVLAHVAGRVGGPVAGEDGGGSPGPAWTGGGPLVRAAARKRMPDPSPGQHPRCRTPRSSNSSRDHPPKMAAVPILSVAPAILLLHRSAKRVGAVPA